MSRSSRTIEMVFAVIAGLVVGALLFIPFSTNPIDAYSTMFREAFLDTEGLGTTLSRSAPLVFVGLGTVVSWKSGFYYLGFQGTLYLGGLGAAIPALAARDGELLAAWPSTLLQIVIFTSAAMFGAVWCWIVAQLKVRFGGNEVLLSLMFNYLAIYLVSYLVSNPMRARGSLPQTERFPDKTLLPRLMGDTNALHAGTVIAAVAAGLIFLMMRSTRLGYDLEALGLNERAAAYSGIDARKSTLRASMIAGALGGMAGWSQVMGVQYRLLDGLDQVTGFEGIVAALLGGLNGVGTFVASVLYGGLANGAQVMQRRTDVPSSVALMIQGIIVLLVLCIGQRRRTGAHLRLAVHSGRWRRGKAAE